jgi:tetratricopeptide (TPR) repeat protein
VVHRDLKPSNILVALYDGRPVPKVIDFGIAKATGPRLTDRNIYTEVGALVGTLEYMAPEQAELNNLDIDTRADVYALGAILYELLTGNVPFSRQELQAAGFLEMLRVIQEVEPPRPSTKLSKSGTLPSVADVRRTDPQKLVSLMRGELDWIILKCLEKDRGRRYQAASGLARDLEHYLADEPVEACPPTAGYRLRKFARKHWTALVTAAAFATLLVAGVVASTWQAVRATSAGREARRLQIAAEQAELEANQQRLAALVAKQQAVEAKTESDRQRDQVSRTAYASGMALAQRAWEENNVARARELLAELPTEAAGRTLRGFEWFYLSRLCHPDELTLVGHAYSVAFSPDGQRLASCGAEQTVKLWDTATGKEVFNLKGHAGRVMSVAFSRDGQRLASGSNDQSVKLWDSATGKELLALKGHASWVDGVAFSPDGQRLPSANGDGSIHLWETASVSREVQHLRATNRMVGDFFGQMHLRADVLERLLTLPGMSPSRRQEALAVAQSYPENPIRLNNLAWELVKLPGGETSVHRKALRYSEEACQLEPENGDFLNTVGVAYYRVGNYEKARDVLSRSDKIHALRDPRRSRRPRHGAPATRPRQGSRGKASAATRADEGSALGASRPGSGLPPRSGRIAGKTQAAEQQVNRWCARNAASTGCSAPLGPEDGSKTSLFEMMVRRQSFGQPLLSHHREADTVRQRPLFVRPGGEQVETRSLEARLIPDNLE